MNQFVSQAVPYNGRRCDVGRVGILERSGGNIVTFLAVWQPHGVQCSPLVGDGPPDLSPALLTTDLHDVRGDSCPHLFAQIENVPKNTEHAVQVT